MLAAAMSERGTSVAVVGLGAMGGRIASRLLAEGYQPVVWNRTQARATDLVKRGAIAATSSADAAARADLVITMVTDPGALEAVSSGPDGIAAGIRPGAMVVEMSTVGPGAIAGLRDRLPAAAGLIDAPVLGSLSEAEQGTLAIFVGGPKELVEWARPVLEALGEVLAVGPLGAGAAAKLVANATLVQVLAGLGETLALARGLGLDDDATHAVLARTPLAAQAQRRRAGFEAGDERVRFPIALAAKDAGLIADAAVAAGLELPLTAAAGEALREAERAGWGERDYSALLRFIASRR